MIKINKIFGFKTNNLYLGELVVQKKQIKKEDVVFIGESFEPKKFVLVRNNFIGYEDIFTKSYYELLGEIILEDGEVAVTNLSPIVTIKERISFNEAVEMLEDANKTKYMRK